MKMNEFMMAALKVKCRDFDHIADDGVSDDEKAKILADMLLWIAHEANAIGYPMNELAQMALNGNREGAER